MGHICLIFYFASQVDMHAPGWSLISISTGWRLRTPSPEYCGFGAAAGPDGSAAGLILISTAPRLMSPDGTYMSHNGTSAGGRGGAGGAPAGHRAFDTGPARSISRGAPAARQPGRAARCESRSLLRPG